MLSSRNVDPIQYRGATEPLSVVRSDCAAEINSAELFGLHIFESWINEEAVENAAEAATERCLKRVSDSDLLIVLYNGRAGWATSEGGVGICHAELARALSESPGKVFIIILPMVASDKESAERDARFQEYIARFRAWRREASTGEAAIQRVKEAIVQGVTEMIDRGTREARRTAGTIGEALDWEKLTLVERQDRMQRVASDFLNALPFAEEPENGAAVLTLAELPIMCVVHAVPESLTFAPARELVGQVFRNDHVVLPPAESPTVGPLHIILVQRGATRTQARTLLGVDDSTCFEESFGVFIADELQKIQLVIIPKCRDDASTRQGLQRWLDWMDQSGEVQTIADRCSRRALIVRATQAANAET
jgi:hypothetical protein